MKKFFVIMLLVLSGCCQQMQEERQLAPVRVQDVVGDFYIVGEVVETPTIWTMNGDGLMTILYRGQEFPVWIVGFSNLPETKMEFTKAKHVEDLLHKEVIVFGYWKDGRIIAKTITESERE